MVPCPSVFCSSPESAFPRCEWPCPTSPDCNSSARFQPSQTICGRSARACPAALDVRTSPGTAGNNSAITNLKGEDVDWTNGTVSFTWKKTGVPVLVHLGGEALNSFKDLPGEGPLFPYLASVRANDRATEFKSRCRHPHIMGLAGCNTFNIAFALTRSPCCLLTCAKATLPSSLMINVDG